MENNIKENKTNESIQSPFAQTYFHGTKANLKIGDFIEIGVNSNYGQKKKANISISLPHLMLLFGALNLQ